jgi:NitT/TauT family transport system substrate-binding protein
MGRLFRSRRLVAGLGVLAIGVLGLAGCGGSSSSGSSGSSGGGSANLPKLVLGSPGIPPVISGLLPVVAQKEGFYKKYGVDVTIKSFSTGTDATRAVSTGQIDTAIMPPAQLVQLAAKGIPLVAMQGQEFPDWVVVSTSPSVNSCQALKGQSVGVDAIGGIRFVALSQMLKSCGLTIKDVHPLAFPGNANPQALAAGQLKVSVLHLNEYVSLQGQKVSLTTAVKMADAVPNTMYEMYGTTKSNLAKKRDAFVRMIAAQTAAIQWMNDPKNADAVAQDATVTGDKKSDLLTAMAQYRQLNFWTSSDAALPELNITKTIKGQVAAGNVDAAKAPKYADIVDLTVFTDAQKMIASK